MGELKIRKECRKQREGKWKVSRKDKIKTLCWSLGGAAVGAALIATPVVLYSKKIKNIEITNRFINRFKPKFLQQIISYYQLTKSQFLDKELYPKTKKQGLFQYTKDTAELDGVKRENAIEDVFLRENFRPVSPDKNKTYPRGTYVEISTPQDEYKFINKVDDPSISWVDYLINNEKGKIWILLYKENVPESSKLKFEPEVPEVPPTPEKPQEQPKTQQLIKKEEK